MPILRIIFKCRIKNVQSDITIIEKLKLEEFLRMNSGAVLDLTNRELQELVAKSTQLDILSDKYNYASGSKANRLRAFIEK